LLIDDHHVIPVLAVARYGIAKTVFVRRDPIHFLPSAALIRRYVQPYRYASPNIPLAAIRRFARRIAERFQPDKIVLFGSYAYGTPHNESDVDLLVAQDQVGRRGPDLATLIAPTVPEPVR
jgi:hypothetical protein